MNFFCLVCVRQGCAILYEEIYLPSFMGRNRSVSAALSPSDSKTDVSTVWVPNKRIVFCLWLIETSQIAGEDHAKILVRREPRCRAQNCYRLKK
jgi:hypothetical protein